MGKKTTSAKTFNLVSSRSPNTGIKSGHAAKLAAALGKVLANTMTLAMKSQNYHWHVSGLHFYSLHEMFGAQYTEINTANDALAERIRALGHLAPATFREYLKISSITEDSALPKNAEVMIKTLLADHEAVVRSCREVMELGEEAGDGVTHDLMNQRMEFHEKTAWMLRATLSA
jgi:starvation-inducible DNA-binding protein